MEQLNYELPEPIEAVVKAEILFDSKQTDKSFYECSIVAINVYPGEAITFSILLSDGSLFDYIPPSFIQQKNFFDSKNILSLKDLVYNNNQSEKFIVNEYNFIKKHENTKFLNCYFKEAGKCFRVKKYYFSIDWFLDNDKRHFVLLENGQFAFVPNHKIKIGCVNMEFEAFKKIRKTFKV